MSLPASVHQLPDADAFTVVGGIQPLLPEGTYQLAFLGYRTIPGFAGTKSLVKGHKAGKLELQFRVVEGDHFDVEVVRFFNVLVPQHASFGRDGKFSLTQRSDFLRTYGRLFGRVTRRDRLSLRKFRNVVIAGTVRHVTVDRNQKPLPPECHYAVVDELLTVEAGSV